MRLARLSRSTRGYIEGARQGDQECEGGFPGVILDRVGTKRRPCSRKESIHPEVSKLATSDGKQGNIIP